MLQAPQLRVLIATPFGARQRGGIDRLMDLIVDTVENSADGRVRVDRLVTRGTGSLVWAPFVFGRALVRFWKLKRRGEVDLLHINLAAGGSAIRKAFLARFARRLGVPYVLHLHGSRFHQFWPSAGPYVRNLVDRMFAESLGQGKNRRAGIEEISSIGFEVTERHPGNLFLGPCSLLLPLSK